jgi:hypothetical protein
VLACFTSDGVRNGGTEPINPLIETTDGWPMAFATAD